MGSTTKLIKKNLKLLIRSKGSALIVVFGPLLVIFLVGLAFDNANAYSVNVGAYSEQFNELSTSFLNQLKKQDFGIRKFADQQGCIKAVEEGEIHLCMVFPEGFTYGEKGKNEVVFHVDYSRINLVYAIIDVITSEVGAKTEELSRDLTNALLKVIFDTKSTVKEQKKTVSAMFIDNNELSKEADKVKEGLEVLNREFGAQTDYMAGIRNRTLWIKDIASWITKYSEEGLESVKAKVGGIDNLSKDQTKDLSETISETIVRVGYLENQLTNKSADLEGYLKGIDKSLKEVESKLGKTAAEGPIFQEIATIRKKVSVMFNNLVKIQEAMNNIDDWASNIRVTDAENIVKPVTTTIKPVTTIKTHLNYLFPSLIVLVIMFVSVFLSSTLVIMEKTSPAYFRNYITPTSDFVFIASTFLTSMILMVIQLVVIIAVSAVFFKAQVFGNLHYTFIVLLMAATLFTLAGMLIGYIFSSEETATLASISVGSVFMLLSSVILPLESMPSYMMQIAKFNPFVISEFLLRRTIIFQSPINELAAEVGYIAGYIALLVVLVLLFEHLMKKHYLRTHAKKIMPIKAKEQKEGKK